jgi:intracellular septation protein
MQSILTFAPLAAFFLAYQLRGIYVATAVLMIAMLLVLAIDWLRTRHIPAVHGFSALLVLVFGGLTLWLRDAHFIQWKPTILFGALAVAHLMTQFIGAKVLAQRLMAGLVPEFQAVRERDWRKVNLASAGFYLALALGNWWVFANFSERIWVNTKTLGLPVLTMVFFVAIALWLMRRPELKDAAANETRSS